ncbi:MAG: hypothetical protein KKG60_00020 [Nanoarchaeota archaeon]|nr:hypothetical protein [Nanoarchaeota archaeon]
MKADKEMKDIEFWEHETLENIYFTLHQDLNKMIDGLNSKDKIKDDWIKAFDRVDKKRQNSDFARGAERIYFWLFNQFGRPNSSPIGADLFFETTRAFVHIDIKTAKLDNPSDYKGKIPISENQTSYSSKNKNFNTNLPSYYNSGKEHQKVCLTYVINIIYTEENSDFKIKAIFLISIPNGKLYPIYGDGIIGQGKVMEKSFRFVYKNNPVFETIQNKPWRVKRIFLDSDLKEEDIMSFELK